MKTGVAMSLATLWGASAALADVEVAQALAATAHAAAIVVADQVIAPVERAKQPGCDWAGELERELIGFDAREHVDQVLGVECDRRPLALDLGRNDASARNGRGCNHQQVKEQFDLVLRQKDARRFADVILQNVRVLAVNSIPDAGTGEPVQAKSVTFATSREDAQKLLVASGLGEISLVLRSPMSESFQPAAGVSDLQVVSSEPPPPQESTVEKADAPVAESSAPNPPPAQSQITVIRGLSSSVVAVP